MPHQKHQIIATVVCIFICVPTVHAVTIVFFNASQSATVVATNMTSTTISSSGYRFTYSQDNWWSPTGSGPPTGRFQSIFWPAGLNAQTQTAGPSGPLTTQIPATITIKRVDGLPFDLTTFTAKILGNTAGAGGAFEIMPLLNGNDGFANPLTLDCTGYSGATFTYNTPELTGFDTYNISMWMDYGLMSLTVVDASLPPPALQISPTSLNSVRLYWPTNSTGYTVQQNSNLGTTNWVNATNSVSIVDTKYQATITTTNGTRFFRLKHP
jgi:hypothetical protein